MPINDNNPERRNLIVLSVAIIAFYMGDATIENNLTLPLVKFSLKNSHDLSILVWSVLVWFTFRFWIETKNKAADAFVSEFIKHGYGYSAFESVIKSDYKLSPGVIDVEVKVERYEYITGRVDEDGDGLFARYKLIPINSNNSSSGVRRDKLKIAKIRYSIILLYIFVCMFFTKPSISANYAPFLVAAIAFGFGVCYSMPYYI